MKYGNQVISSIRLGSQAIITKIAKGLTIVYEAWKTLIKRGKTPLTITNCQPDTTAIDYTIYGGNDFKSILPDEYQQVEYIQTTETQYIDSGVPLKCGLKTIVDWVYEDAASYNSYTGAHIGSPGNRWLIGSQRQNKVYFFGVGAGNTSTGIKFGNRDIVEAYWADKASYIKINGVQSISTYDHFALVEEPNYTFYMGAVDRDGNATLMPKLTIYNWKFYQDDILIRDYVPCYRKSDKVAGLYDIVTNEFYTNDGTGEFIVGEPTFPNPTPDAPIEMKGVGDRTNNLLDEKLLGQVEGYNTYENGMWTTSDLGSYGRDIFYSAAGTNHSVDINKVPKVTPNTTITIKFYDYINNGIDMTYTLYIGFYDSEGTYISRDTVNPSSVSTKEIPENAHYISFLRTSNYGTISFSHIQIVEGSYTEATIPDYEPYGYKIPIKIEREVLPVEYQQVEYIEATGTQYINSNFYPDSNSAIEMDVLVKTVTSNKNNFIFGVTNTGNTRRFALNVFNSTNRQDLGVYLRFSTNAPSTPAKIIDFEEWHNFRLDKGNYYMDDELLDSYSDTFEKNETPLYINAYNNAGTLTENYIGNTKIKSCKIWDNGVLVRDMIPCYRKSDNMVGMYDLVNGVFYAGVGTESFLFGNEVKNLETTVYLDQPINKVGTCMNSMSYKTQSIIKPLGHYQFDGSESWEEHTTAKGCKVYRLDGVLTPKAGAPMSDTYMTHFGLSYIYSTADFIPGFYRFASGNPVEIISAGSSRLYISSTCETVEEFKEWLSVNKPSVYYPLAETETINIELPELYLPDETNIITVDTEVSPDTIEITYKGRE